MAAKVKAAKKKGANGYKLPNPIPPGEILTDVKKNQWILDKSIGVGGFGEVYSAAPYTGKPPKDFPNVIKIEPHGNGPLFVEMHFYMRNAKLDEIEAWRKQKKLSGLGMPPYIASGSHEHKNTKYRFVVMNRYGVDLWKLFEANKRQFPEHTVYKLALQIVNILEYIHSKKYVHADVKGSNLLLDLKSPNQVYLVDFGLASRYTTKDVCERDPRKAHNGTIEYTSRDAHMGVPTMRGDMEILGYNIIQWLCSSLLWEKDLSDVVKVQNQKEEAFENIPEFLKKSFKESIPSPVLKYMSQLASMKFNDVPDYDKFKKILTDGLKQLSHKPDGKLEFGNSDVKHEVLKSTPKKSKKVVKSRKSPGKRTKKVLNDDDSEEESNKRIKTAAKNRKSPVRRTKEVLNDEESDEESYKKIDKTTVKGRKSPGKRTRKVLSDDESAEESHENIKTTVKNRKSPGRRTKEVLDDGDSDEESSKKIVKKTVKGRKNPGKRTSEVLNDDESDDETFKKIVKTTVKSRKTSGKRTNKVLNDDESDEDA
ncbi:serine/threonine-protein kinase VRK1-like [Halictus rubicundus]|uniref:serine/threonine-protein kinase VRK1-like n=1 Tax=Halictus rubicundus TaxID=77578 RepID=UPI004036556A